MKMDCNLYRNFYFETVTEILNTPSPSGYGREILPLLRRLASETGCLFEETARGCALLTIPGERHDGALGLCAHCDTLGLMVRSIGADGGLNVTAIGGPLMPTLDGEYCTVITREGKKYSGTILCKSPAVHVYDNAASLERNEKNLYVRLDEVVHTGEDVKALGISNGDYIAYDPKVVVTESGFLKSRFIDDKASVAMLLTVAKMLHDQGIVPGRDVKMLITLYEEVGHGASWVPDGLVSMLGVDMGCIGEDLACTEYDVSICAKDSGGPYHYELTSRLIGLAKQNGLSYAVDIYPHYGSDVEAMQRAGYDVPGALIGTGVHASHGMERTHWEGIRNTLELILLYLEHSNSDNA